MIHTLILGLDAFDPRVFERLLHEGRMPNLASFVERNGYAELRIANPPQSEVSWTSIATGLDPGAHGMFDFVHRDPASHTPFVSLLPTQEKLGLTRFVRPFSARTIFDMTADRGYPSTSLWWPGTFPARPESPVRTLPGLGTPDVMGRLGVGCLYSADPALPDEMGKTPVLHLRQEGAERFAQRLIGPRRKRRSSEVTLSIPLRLEIRDQRAASLEIGGQVVDLVRDEWSPVLDLRFPVGRFASVRAITRVVLTGTRPPTLYVLPLQLHPLAPIWPYGTPRGFVRRTWESCGPFLTLGWPQDTAGLEDGCITDDHFVALCRSVDDSRARVLLHLLEDFREGILAGVFDTLDRIQHMYLRDRPDIVEGWYRRLDAFVGEVAAKFEPSAGDDRRLVILSDHGVGPVEHVVHLNRWLIDQGLLGVAPGSPSGSGRWSSIDWGRTEAYAIGLNSVYLNLEGREGRGIVSPGRQEELCERIRRDLARWVGPDGRPVVARAWLNGEAFRGALASYGPDLVVGYSVGYRASPETGLGGWGERALEPNDGHWGADHCFDVGSVPGVLFSSRALTALDRPSYRDIPMLTIEAEPDEGSMAPPPSIGKEDTDLIEERLRSLGYL